jgi:hypothetical protein
MKTLVPFALAATALIPADGVEVATRYTPGQAYTVRREVAETRTTEREMLRDGEPQEGRGGFGGGGGETTRESVIEYTDQVVEAGEGPTKLRRSYTELASSTLISAAGEELERAMESPFTDLVLLLEAGEDGVEVEVLEGEQPEEERLAGMRLDLFIDGLLPGRKVDVDDTWELDAAAVTAALGENLERQLFQAPEPEEDAGGRGGRGGRRGGFGGPREGGERMEIEWTGTATVTDLNAEHEGRPVVAIRLEIEASGDLPELDFGGGGGGRGGRGGGDALGASGSRDRVLDNTYSHELEGQVLFDPELGLPVLLELSGTLTTERYFQRDRGDSLLEVTTQTSTAVDHVITVEPTQVEED